MIRAVNKFPGKCEGRGRVRSNAHLRHSVLAGVLFASRAFVGLEKRVLVVDDDAPIRNLVKKIVQRNGLSVEVACDGSEAIEKLDQGGFDVLVCDLMMPGVDGFQVVEHAGKLSPRPAIIVITASDPGMIRRLNGKLVHSVVRKPFDIDVLGDLVSAAAGNLNDGEADLTNVVEFHKPA